MDTTRGRALEVILAPALDGFLLLTHSNSLGSLGLFILQDQPAGKARHETRGSADDTGQTTSVRRRRLPRSVSTWLMSRVGRGDFGPIIDSGHQSCEAS